jgi:raffinose/stachyose/melibiose transport system substrate-binding protein
MAVNQRLKDNGIPPLALDGNISFYNAYYYYWACARVLGSGKFSEAAHDKTGAAWDDPGFLQAAQMVYDISRGGRNFFQDGYEGSAYPSAQSDWALGKAGSVLCGTWIPNETGPIVASDWEYGFYPFPSVDGARGSINDVESYLIGYAIPKDAKNPDNAKAFIKFALKREWARRYVQLSDNMSGRKDADPPPVLSDVTAYLANATGAHPSYDGLMNDLPEWWANVFYPVDNDLIFGRITPQQFIDRIKAQTIDYWQGRIELGSGVR